MPERARRRTTVAEDGLVELLRREQSDRERLEKMLWRSIDEAGLPEPDEFQYRWARSEGRMYRSDAFYRLPIPTLIEVDGGTWIGGGHSRGSGFEHDRRRDNLAALLGYRVLRFTKEMVRDGTAVLTIRRALAGVEQNTSRPEEQRGLCDVKSAPTNRQAPVPRQRPGVFVKGATVP